MLHITWLHQFAGVVSNLADTTIDSLSHQQAISAPESSQGAATPQLQVGDHVLGACRFGSYTTCLNVPAQQVLFRTPQNGAVVAHLLFVTAESYEQ